MTIYVDVIIFENIIMNFIILYVTGLVTKSKINIFRLFFSKFYLNIEQKKLNIIKKRSWFYMKKIKGTKNCAPMPRK